MEILKARIQKMKGISPSKVLGPEASKFYESVSLPVVQGNQCPIKMGTKKLEPDESEPVQKLNVPEKRRCHSEILPRSDDGTGRNNTVESPIEEGAFFESLGVTHKAFDAMPTSKSVTNLGEEVEEPEEGTNLAVDGEETAEESQENQGMIEPQVCWDLGRRECVVDTKSVAGLDSLRMVGTGMKQLGEIMQSSSSVPQTVPGGNWRTQLQSGVFETPTHHASAEFAPRSKSWASVLNSECSGILC
ncbi:hypothetical protein U1Q18_037818 [Sarracenia purpurea var. burkii]